MSTTVCKCVSSTCLPIASSSGLTDGTYFYPEKLNNNDALYVYSVCFTGTTQLTRCIKTLHGSPALEVNTLCMYCNDKTFKTDTLCTSTTQPKLSTNKIVTVSTDDMKEYRVEQNDKTTYITGTCAYTCYSCVIPAGYYASRQLFSYLDSLAYNVWYQVSPSSVSLIAGCTDDIHYSGCCGLATPTSSSPYPSLFKCFNYIQKVCTYGGYQCGIAFCYQGDSPGFFSGTQWSCSDNCRNLWCCSVGDEVFLGSYVCTCTGKWASVWDSQEKYGVFISSLVCFC